MSIMPHRIIGINIFPELKDKFPNPSIYHKICLILKLFYAQNTCSVVIPSGRIEETGCSFCFQEEEGGGLSQCPTDWTLLLLCICASTAAASTKGILCYNFTIQFKVFTSIQGYSIRKKMQKSPMPLLLPTQKLSN